MVRRVLVPFAVTIVLLSSCSRDPLVGTWSSSATMEGQDATKYVEGSFFTFKTGGTFTGEIRDRRNALIVGTKGSYMKDGETIHLTGTQTLLKPDGRGEVGSSKPYKLKLVLESGRLRIDAPDEV